MKERLTGAAILVALIVLLVPELLRGPVRPVAHAAAAPGGDPPLRYTIKLNDDAHGHGAAPALASGPQQPAPIPADSEPGPQPASTPTAAAEPPAEAPAPTPAATVETPASRPSGEHAPGTEAAAAPPAPADNSASGAFMVQLGSFASHDNAERLAKQVKAQGFTVSVARGTTGKHLYKVLVGPAHDHAAAVQLEAKLRASGHSGAIVAK